MYSININDVHIFEIDEDKTVLESLEQKEIYTNHQCRNGRCMSCRAELISGSIKLIRDTPTITKDPSKGQFILSCISKPTSDLKIRIQISPSPIIEPIYFPGKISSIINHNDDICELKIRLKPNFKFNFYNGQYVNLTLDKIKRSYSIAGYNPSENSLYFVIKNYLGEFSNIIFQPDSINYLENKLIYIDGPYGTFYYSNKPNSNRIIFLATGTGIAPCIPIIQGIIKDNSSIEIILAWGNREKSEYFIRDAFFDNLGIRYVKYISSENRNKNERYVQSILNKYDDLSETMIYACGNPNMITEAYKIAREKKIKINCFKSDAFIKS